MLVSQCLDQRISTIDELEQLLAAWGRIRKGAPIHWQFDQRRDEGLADLRQACNPRGRGVAYV